MPLDGVASTLTWQVYGVWKYSQRPPTASAQHVHNINTPASAASAKRRLARSESVLAENGVGLSCDSWERGAALVRKVCARGGTAVGGRWALGRAAAPTFVVPALLGDSTIPHSSQNLAPSRTVWRQLGQIICPFDGQSFAPHRRISAVDGNWSEAPAVDEAPRGAASSCGVNWFCASTAFFQLPARWAARHPSF